MTEESSFETIEFEVDAQVATLTLNRPERLNAFNETMAEEVASVWKRVRSEDAIHVVVLQANGERAFCTGLDVAEGSWWRDRNIWIQQDPGVLLGPKQHRVWKPVVAAVHGMCAGGGQYFVNEADIVVCSEEATFFDPHANAGTVSALEPIGMLKRGVPLGEVLRWALMGTEERITAETARQIGIVTEVVPRGDLRARARSIATQIASRNPIAVQGTVMAIWESTDMTRHAALEHGMSYTHIGNPEERIPIKERQGGPPEFR